LQCAIICFPTLPPDSSAPPPSNSNMFFLGINMNYYYYLPIISSFIFSCLILIWSGSRCEEIYSHYILYKLCFISIHQSHKTWNGYKRREEVSNKQRSRYLTVFISSTILTTSIYYKLTLSASLAGKQDLSTSNTFW
jgi:hypothetical protein